MAFAPANLPSFRTGTDPDPRGRGRIRLAHPLPDPTTVPPVVVRVGVTPRSHSVVADAGVRPFRTPADVPLLADPGPADLHRDRCRGGDRLNGLVVGNACGRLVGSCPAGSGNLGGMPCGELGRDRVFHLC